MYKRQHVGRLVKEKNQLFLLEIIAEAKHQGLNFKLLLVGNGEDDCKLKRKAQKLGIADKVIFYGGSNSPEKLMNCMDCFVMPSIFEGFPVTLVEAQAAGLPCLVSDIVSKEVNVTGYVEFASLKESPCEWVKKISKLKGRYNGTVILREKGYAVDELEQKIRPVSYTHLKIVSGGITKFHLENTILGLLKN